MEGFLHHHPWNLSDAVFYLSDFLGKPPQPFPSSAAIRRILLSCRRLRLLRCHVLIPLSCPRVSRPVRLQMPN